MPTTTEMSYESGLVITMSGTPSSVPDPVTSHPDAVPPLICQVMAFLSPAGSSVVLLYSAKPTTGILKVILYWPTSVVAKLKTSCLVVPIADPAVAGVVTVLVIVGEAGKNVTVGIADTIIFGLIVVDKPLIVSDASIPEVSLGTWKQGFLSVSPGIKNLSVAVVRPTKAAAAVFAVVKGVLVSSILKSGAGISGVALLSVTAEMLDVSEVILNVISVLPGTLIEVLGTPVARSVPSIVPMSIMASEVP